MREELRAGLFGMDPDAATFKRRPRYHSNDRGSDIVFDLAIEIHMGLSAAPFITILIECKDYSGPIPVDDVEEFKAKLDQCFGKNVKGMLVTSSVLQPGALNYAKSHGIAHASIRVDHSYALHTFDCRLGRHIKIRHDRVYQELFQAPIIVENNKRHVVEHRLHIID